MPCLILAVASWLSPVVGLSADSVSEYQVKAAVLYNFAKFVDWPPEAFRDSDPSLRVCLFGEDPFGGLLQQTIQGKTAQGRKVTVGHVKDLQDAKTCHILFISSSERKRLEAILERLTGASVLTVGESESFARQGGMIYLTLEEDKVRFEINLASAERARLKISSKLVALAKTVYSGGRN